LNETLLLRKNSELFAQLKGEHTLEDETDPHSARQEQISRLRKAIIFAFVFMVVEVIGGWFANSMAIMTDAAHMLSDVGGFYVSLFALGFTSKEANKYFSYGYHQAEIIGAFLSILIVWMLTGVLIVEAIQRIKNLEDIDGVLMFSIATFGFVVNLGLMKVLGHGHSHGGGGDHGHSHGGGGDHGHSHGGNGGGGDHGHSHGGGEGRFPGYIIFKFRSPLYQTRTKHYCSVRILNYLPRESTRTMAAVMIMGDMEENMAVAITIMNTRISFANALLVAPFAY